MNSVASELSYPCMKARTSPRFQSAVWRSITARMASAGDCAKNAGQKRTAIIRNLIGEWITQAVAGTLPGRQGVEESEMLGCRYVLLSFTVFIGFAVCAEVTEVAGWKLS